MSHDITKQDVLDGLKDHREEWETGTYTRAFYERAMDLVEAAPGEPEHPAVTALRRLVEAHGRVYRVDPHHPDGGGTDDEINAAQDAFDAEWDNARALLGGAARTVDVKKSATDAEPGGSSDGE